MTIEGMPSLLQKSPIVRWLSRCFTGRGLRRSVLVLLWISTVIALFYAEENWRGRRAWRKYRDGLEKSGAKLDLQSLWPKPVPDDQNFAAIPLIRSWMERPGSSQAEQRWHDDFPIAERQITNWWHQGSLQRPRNYLDLVAWQEAIEVIRAGKLDRYQRFDSRELDRASRAKAAPAVLATLQTNASVFAELRNASRRPSVHFPNAASSPHSGIQFWHLDDFSHACHRLSWKACAELALGHSDKAREDVMLILFLSDSSKAAPAWDAQWVRLNRLQRAIQPLWEGLAEHAWSDSDLVALSSRLAEHDFLTDGKLGIDGERALILWAIDLLPQNDDYWLFGAETSTLARFTRWPEWICRIIPRGWLGWEKINFCEMFDAFIRAGFEPGAKRVRPGPIEANGRQAMAERDRYAQKGIRALLRHRISFGLSQPEVNGSIRLFCIAQCINDQAMLACALERYRLARGEFPSHLGELAPAFLTKVPADALTGEPYKYKRTPNGQFLLYSVGWNEKDEDGTTALRKDGTIDFRHGDWVWQYPQN